MYEIFESVQNKPVAKSQDCSRPYCFPPAILETLSSPPCTHNLGGTLSEEEQVRQLRGPVYSSEAADQRKPRPGQLTPSPEEHGLLGGLNRGWPLGTYSVA